MGKYPHLSINLENQRLYCYLLCHLLLGGSKIMRELAVYYCPKCGYYGYFHLEQNAICPNCLKKLDCLDLPYPDFVNLSLEARDALLIQKILSHDPSVSNRILTADRAHSYRKTIATLHSQVYDLKLENKQLLETLNWMHETIWELLSKKARPDDPSSQNNPDSPDEKSKPAD